MRPEREALIEAMAAAVCPHVRECHCFEQAEVVLMAIEEHGARIVPHELNPKMWELLSLFLPSGVHPESAYQPLLAISPYAPESTDDHQKDRSE